jgi:hypothetical protein
VRRWLIASVLFVVWLLVLLAGSDKPPPLGFLWIVAGLIVICVAIGFALPWLWRVREESGVWSVAWRTTTLGALVGFVLAALFGLGGSGEPSAPPMDGIDYAIWFTVLTIVGAVNGLIVGLVAIIARPRGLPTVQ